MTLLKKLLVFLVILHGALVGCMVVNQQVCRIVLAKNCSKIEKFT